MFLGIDKKYETLSMYSLNTQCEFVTERRAKTKSENANFKGKKRNWKIC